MIGKQVTLVHGNAASVEHGLLRVDRKFHLGMLRYVEQIRARCVTLHPRLQPGQQVMDPIEVPVASLPYDIETVQLDARGGVSAEGAQAMRRVIGAGALTYGMGMMGYEISRELKRPYVSMQEYDLQTQLTVTTSQVHSPLHKLVRAGRCVWNYRTRFLPELRGADAVHCNGFPVYDVARRYNGNCLLYLDSRMSGASVIAPEQLSARTGSLRGRRLRLLYSGRYEPLKGAVDAVKVGAECLRRGLDIEMHCYGQGSLKSAMEEVARASADPGRIFIHDAVPYPELERIAREFDLFICCHIQNDPSCTYLESFGAGLPVVGYSNRMWRRLHQESKVGLASPLGRPSEVASGIQELMQDPGALAEMSTRAAQFARRHAFEVEFSRRTEAINQMIA